MKWSIITYSGLNKRLNNITSSAYKGFQSFLFKLTWGSNLNAQAILTSLLANVHVFMTLFSPSCSGSII